MLGKPRQHGALSDALGARDTAPEALFALGFAGTRDAAELALQAMADESLAPLAAEAFCAITGLDLELHGFTVPRPEPPREPVPFDAEELDADLVSHPDDLLPVPDVSAVRRWWVDNGRALEPERRYLRGEPHDVPRLHRGLCSEPMRRRHGLALELAVRTHGLLQLQTRAFGEDQKRALAAHGPETLAATRSPLAKAFS